VPSEVALVATDLSSEEQRLIVAVLVERARYGAAHPEVVIKRARLSRTEGYALLAALERRSLLLTDDDGIGVTFHGSMLAGLS